MIFNKKYTYEQHDNEKSSFYNNSIKPLNSKDILDQNIEVDVCVVGGGLTGVSSTLNLSKKGYSVVLCEARKVGWGASGRNGGQLGIGMRKDQIYLERKLGINHAKELWNLSLESVEETLSLIEEYNIDCSLVNGVLFAGCFESNIKEFELELNHMKKFYNFDGYKLFNNKEISKEINSKIYKSGLINSYSYHLNPLKLLIGISHVLKKMGIKVFENSPVTKLEELNDYVLVHCKKNIIKSQKVVVGCNGYLDRLIGNKRNKFMPINNYMIATEPLGKEKARED